MMRALLAGSLVGLLSSVATASVVIDTVGSGDVIARPTYYMSLGNPSTGTGADFVFNNDPVDVASGQLTTVRWFQLSTLKVQPLFFYLFVTDASNVVKWVGEMQVTPWTEVGRVVTYVLPTPVLVTTGDKLGWHQILGGGLARTENASGGSNLIQLDMPVPEAGDTIQDSYDPSNEPYLFSIKGDIEPVPLPAAVWLLLSGLVGLGAMVRRKAH